MVEGGTACVGFWDWVGLVAAGTRGVGLREVWRGGGDGEERVDGGWNGGEGNEGWNRGDK